MPENLKPWRKGTRPEGEVDVNVEDDTDYRGQGIQARAFAVADTYCTLHVSFHTHCTLSNLTFTFHNAARSPSSLLHCFVAKFIL
jgi:hypothetical protein